VGAIITQTRTPVDVCGIDVIFSDYHVAFYFFANDIFKLSHEIIVIKIEESLNFVVKIKL
jgi:hypothetical protein